MRYEKTVYVENFHGEVSLRRTFLAANCPTAKCPTAKCPTAKCSYGEVSVRRSVRTAKCLTAKSPVTVLIREANTDIPCKTVLNTEVVSGTVSFLFYFC